MATKRELTCINCPLGCQVTVTLDGDHIISVTGNTCPRGERYARNEVIDPRRTVTTTVPVVWGMRDEPNESAGDCGSKRASSDAGLPPYDGPRVVSVKTASDIPKDKIFDCIKALSSVVAHAPVHIGDVVLPNVCDTGVDVVATKNV